MEVTVLAAQFDAIGIFDRVFMVSALKGDGLAELRNHCASLMPPGKVLEMATIDAAKALGMEKEIGSLEAGKKADVILLDWFKPHMVPMNMPVYRIVYFAEGTDVATVLVDGKVLMRDRKVLTVNEEQILTRAQQQADLAIKRSGLESLTAMPAGFWGKTKLGK